jgi:hypothetical protein
METLEVLRREIKALAFDQYGTIVDMQRGLTGSGLIEQEQRRLRTGFFVDNSAQDTRRWAI